MYKHRRFTTAISGTRWVSESYLKTFLPRQPVGKLERLHPGAKKVFNRMIQTPDPLTYKISDTPKTPPLFDLNPQGVKEKFPFSILRTHANNLPVYSDFKNNRNLEQTTIIRHLRGDIDAFVQELSKIVSNSRIEIKTGKVVIRGIHVEKVKFWLMRLGF